MNGNAPQEVHNKVNGTLNVYVLCVAGQNTQANHFIHSFRPSSAQSSLKSPVLELAPGSQELISRCLKGILKDGICLGVFWVIVRMVVMVVVSWNGKGGGSACICICFCFCVCFHAYCDCEHCDATVIDGQRAQEGGGG
jgi:hypothetical protein